MEINDPDPDTETRDDGSCRFDNGEDGGDESDTDIDFPSKDVDQESLIHRDQHGSYHN
jgi:hypothetical protein